MHRPMHRRGDLAVRVGLAALALGLAALQPVLGPSTPAGAGSAHPGTSAQSDDPATTTTPGGTALPVAVDPALLTGLDGVVALSPPESCLRVDIARATVFRHQADRALVPASTQKVVVGQVALDRLGADHRFRTRVLGPAPVDGVVTGDVALVGGGDPLLTTATYAFVRRTAEQPLTFLDALADALVAGGVRRVTGRIVADDTRYDALRTVPSWPERYQRENQVGPLGALTVDDGFRLDLPAEGSDDAPVRRRVDDPALHAAEQLNALLFARGVAVDGGVALGPAPPGAGELAAIDSAPLGDVVRQMLEESDNGTAELLTKELGVQAGTGGSTAAGTAAIVARAGELGVPTAGTVMADGSGLDRTNHTSCDALVGALVTSGGVDGAIGSRLPVAGRSGTLRDRFLGTPAQGRLRAKTGSLNSVTALAGFVTMSDGRTATFAYIANGPQAEDPRRGQDFLGALLGQYEQACDDTPGEPLVAPVGSYVVQSAALAAVPLAGLLAPALEASLRAFEDHPEVAVSACLAGAPGFTLWFPGLAPTTDLPG
jgi:D-alanyl-D-alanine carboxypeptidase/D-alanyl-D-alanine-endopeptidase (penicillin-binding protein 4)